MSPRSPRHLVRRVLRRGLPHAPPSTLRPGQIAASPLIARPAKATSSATTTNTIANTNTYTSSCTLRRHMTRPCCRAWRMSSSSSLVHSALASAIARNVPARRSLELRSLALCSLVLQLRRHATIARRRVHCGYLPCGVLRVSPPGHLCLLNYCYCPGAARLCIALSRDTLGVGAVALRCSAGQCIHNVAGVRAGKGDEEPLRLRCRPALVDGCKLLAGSRYPVDATPATMRLPACSSCEWAGSLVCVSLPFGALDQRVGTRGGRVVLSGFYILFVRIHIVPNDTSYKLHTD